MEYQISDQTGRVYGHFFGESKRAALEGMLDRLYDTDLAEFSSYSGESVASILSRFTFQELFH